jgi:hypothetical protein
VAVALSNKKSVTNFKMNYESKKRYKKGYGALALVHVKLLVRSSAVVTSIGCPKVVPEKNRGGTRGRLSVVKQEREAIRQCFLFSNHLIVTTRSAFSFPIKHLLVTTRLAFCCKTI